MPTCLLRNISLCKEQNSYIGSAKSAKKPALSAVRADNLIEEKCLQLFSDFKETLEKDVKVQIHRN